MKLPVRIRHTRPSPEDLMQLVHIHPVTCKSNTKDQFLLCLLNDDCRPTGFAFSAYEGSHADLPHGDHYVLLIYKDPFEKHYLKNFLLSKLLLQARGPVGKSRIIFKIRKVHREKKTMFRMW